VSGLPRAPTVEALEALPGGGGGALYAGYDVGRRHDRSVERLVQRWGHRAEAVTFTAPAKSELAMPLLRLFQDKLVRVPAEAEVREGLHSVRKIVTAANNIRLDADRDERGHADRFWALALANHAADDFKMPLPRPLARKPLGW
jgi:phage FluMu gp28-like protein